MNINSYTQAKEFAIARGNQQHPFTLSQFMDEVHTRFYSHVDISFKDYFMEIVDQEGQFVVHHSKLLEYGVVTSKRSSDIKDKLDAFGMVEGVDFELRSTPQLRNQGGTNIVKSYILTPESFKKCLMRARRHAGQPVDPVIYADYFLLLEKMVKLFSLYEKSKAEAMIASQNVRIEFMIAEMQRERDDAQREREEAQREREAAKQRDAEQQRKINELLGYAVETKEALVETKEALAETNVKLDDVKTELVEANVDRYEFKKQFSLVIDQLDEMSEKLDEAKEERSEISDELAETREQVMLISEELTETREQVALISNELGIEQNLRQNAVLATEVAQNALMDQMTKSGAVNADPGLHHVGCIMGRWRNGELELNFIGRQLNSAIPLARAMARDGYSPVIPMFFSVDPIALRCATAEKNKEDVLSVFDRVTKTLRNAFGRTLQKLGFKADAIVPAIGKQKTFIPLGCSFTQENFLANLESVLLETTGMKLSEAINLAKRDMEAMGREYDVDVDGA